MNYGVIFAALFLMIILFLIIRVMIVPIQWIVKLLVNSVLALVGLLIINAVGSLLGFHLPLNPFSVIGIALLGVPGLILLVIMNFLMI